jgi:hypothetical protein
MPSREFDEYRREKREERKHQEGAAKAERDPEFQKRDHLDPLRDPKRRDVPADAEGQAERGTIDQTITDKGYTEG